MKEVNGRRSVLMHDQIIQSRAAKSTVENGCGGFGTKLGWR